MAAPGNAPISVTLEPSSIRGAVTTQTLLAAMLRACSQISDLIFSPGRLPQVEVHGHLLTVEAPGLRLLTADDTRRIASDLIGDNKQAITMLREQGSCDVSYGLPGVARFRANIFIQRGSCAVVMRVIPTVIPDFRSLGLPSQLEDVATLRDGIVLVTGPRGSGKSSTLAALLDRINEHQTCHIITIEDPIEFLHNHKRATVHQRELHSDTPSFALALRAALRQAPRVILVGEIHDRATMETVIEAAETGHLVLSSFNSVDVAKTVSRIIGLFSPGEQHLIRGRLAKTLRYIVSQRLIPRRDGGGRVAAVEIFKSTPRSSGHIECDDPGGANLLDAIRSGEAEGMQHFDASIEKLVRDGVIDREAAVVYASDAQSLQRSLERDAGYIFAGDGKKR